VYVDNILGVIRGNHGFFQQHANLAITASWELGCETKLLSQLWA